MPRLTIIVPLQKDVPAFELALASVLQNRPPNCEILVPHAGGYDDPYALDGEVRFLEQSPDATLVDLLNSALERARSELLHVISPGHQVMEGWTDEAIRLFDDPQVGSVVPVIVSATDPRRAASCGVGYGIGGVRLVAGAGQSTQTIATRPPQTCGPALAAAFYRTDPLCSLEGFSSDVGDGLADIDLALSLRAAGYSTAICPTCVVHANPQRTAPESSYEQGRNAERLFRRHLRHIGGVKSLLAHPLTVLLGAVGDIPHPGAVAQLAGRLAAWFEQRSLRRYRELLDEARDEAACAAHTTLRMPDARRAPAPGKSRRAA